MRLDYFYNTEGENFRFYQIPALLLEEEEYRGIIIWSIIIQAGIIQEK